MILFEISIDRILKKESYMYDKIKPNQFDLSWLGKRKYGRQVDRNRLPTRRDGLSLLYYKRKEMSRDLFEQMLSSHAYTAYLYRTELSTFSKCFTRCFYSRNGANRSKVDFI